MRNLFLTFTLASTLASNLALAFTPTEDGLYAVFDTSMGEFTCELFFDETTQTVANFVGLAEGDIDWLNSDGKIQVNTPYYNGQSFHRVISGFMIQAGAFVKGNGATPGYTIYNECIVDDAKYTHDRAGVLSMANTGFANSGGGQFFVTVAPATHLDGKHTVFGQIVEGQDIVDAINAVPVIDTTNYVPVDDVIINSLTIVREGQAAIDFNAGDYLVPTLGEPGPDFSAAFNNSDQIELTFDVQPDASYTVYQSPDLETWSFIGTIGRDPTAPGPTSFSIGAGLPSATAGFWASVRTNYPKLADKSGHTIVITDNPDSPSMQHTIELGANYSGTIDIAGSGEYPILDYYWHTYGSGWVTLTVLGEGLRQLQYTFLDGPSGDAQYLLERTSSFDSFFLGDLHFEQTTAE